MVPFGPVCRLTPPAPADETSIREAISEGLFSEEGAFLVRAEGFKDETSVRINNCVNAPGLLEYYEKYKTTHESLLTGQVVFLFTKLFILDKLSDTVVYPL